MASETCLHLFRPAQMHSDTFRYVRKCSEAFGRVRILLELFQTFFVLVPNTSEANDETWGPTAPEISEMCFLSSRLKVIRCCSSRKTITGFASKQNINSQWREIVSRCRSVRIANDWKQKRKSYYQRQGS